MGLSVFCKQRTSFMLNVFFSVIWPEHTKQDQQVWSLKINGIVHS